jgi:glycerol-3-phosphate acyltransferase PlsY
LPVSGQLAPVLAAAVAGYFVGAIPIPYLIVRAKTGRDLRTVHTGNVGVMNSASVLGRYVGLGVLLAELLKGMACAWLGSLIGAYPGAWAGLLAGVVGANWSVYLKGSGGRGNTTFGGGLLLIDFRIFAVLACIFAVGRTVSGSSFFAARLNMVLMPFVFAGYAWLTGRQWSEVLAHAVVGLAFAAVFRVKHSRRTDDHAALRAVGRLPGGAGARGTVGGEVSEGTED